jgi:hypothetical protein
VRGRRLPASLFARSFWFDPALFRLPLVSWPLQWVRYFNDALLVDVRTGEVVDVIEGIFW